MYYLLLTFAYVLSRVPTKWCYALGRGIGTWAYYLFPIRRQVARENVDRVFGDTLSTQEKNRIVLESYHTLGTVGLETIRLRFVSKEDVLRSVDVHGSEHIDNAVQKKRGAIVVSGHFGNIVISGCAEAARGVPVHVIAKNLRNKAAEKIYFDTIRKFGITRIPTGRSKGQIVSAIEQGAAVYMAVDQHMPAHRGIVCKFFGHDASTSPAPVRFARQTGAPIVPCRGAILSKQGRNELHYQEEFVLETENIESNDILRHNTERLNEIMESYLKMNPGQWLWQHKRWKVQDLSAEDFGIWVAKSEQHFQNMPSL